MSLKSAFISLWMLLLAFALVHTGISLWRAPTSLVWWAALLALLPVMLFFAGLFLQRTPRTSRIVAYPFVAQIVALGLLLVAAPGGIAPWIYVVGVGGLGSLLYQFWYSRLDRKPADMLVEGEWLQPLVFDDATGKPFSTDDLQGPLLMIFFRGNWCPLCMAQIREIAGQYRELASRGVNTLLISPQPHDNTRELALKFDVPFLFLVDREFRVAQELGIMARGGTPMGMEMLGYESDTVYPTVVMTDARRRIIFVDQTDNYRVRPEPETFLRVLDQHGLQSAG